jgi:uncharacterized MAPEG superfamily protein
VTTPLWCLVVVSFLPYALSFLGGYYRTRQLGRLDNKYPRQQAAQLQGIGARVYAAQANAWEALGFFTAVLVVLHLANREAAASVSAGYASLGFAATRVLHAGFYLANLDALRSLSFVVGIGCAIWLLSLA